MSAVLCWRCNISIHLSPRPVTGWCPPFSAGHVAFLFICLPGLLLLVSALFRWPCSITIHLSPRSVTIGVRPCPLTMQHFYSFAGVRPFPLATQHFYCWCPPFSVGHVAFLFICLPGLSLVVSAFSAGHVAFLFICLPNLSSALFRWPCSISIHLSPTSVAAGVRLFPLAM